MLNKPALVDNLENAFKKVLAEGGDPDSRRREICQAMADAVEVYLKSGTLTIEGTSNNGPFTGTGKIE